MSSSTRDDIKEFISDTTNQLVNAFRARLQTISDEM